MKQDPSKLPGLLFMLMAAAACVWGLFHGVLPVLVAQVLLVGATQDYLFPVRYRITESGVYADGLTSRNELAWGEVKRCVEAPGGVLVTPLAAPSRLDGFRGIFLRYAPEGTPGDRKQVTACIEHAAPDAVWMRGRLAAADGAAPGKSAL